LESGWVGRGDGFGFIAPSSVLRTLSCTYKEIRFLWQGAFLVMGWCVELQYLGDMVPNSFVNNFLLSEMESQSASGRDRRTTSVTEKNEITV
jgi:hypothetical protein